MSSKLIISLVVFSVAISIANAIVCTPDFCSRVRCANANAEICEAKNMIYKEKGSMCGCCNVCLIKLNKGDKCGTTMIRGLPPTSACDAGLVCDATTKVCA